MFVIQNSLFPQTPKYFPVKSFIESHDEFKNGSIFLYEILTPLGPMLCAAVENGVCLLEFSDRPELEKELKVLQSTFQSGFIEGHNEHIETLKVQIGEYFKGTRTSFSIPIITTGSDFQKDTWEILKTIPYGKTISYRKQAQLMDLPKAVRAIAKANGTNKLAILIPCHRVVAENGQLTGYSGGLWRKEWLITFEKNNLLKLAQPNA